jgi:hypothetical protein
MEESVESDSDEVDNVHKESSSEYDEHRRSPLSIRQDDFGRLRTTNSSSSGDIDVASHGDDGHGGDRLKTVTSASLSTLIVMVECVFAM